MPQDAIGMVPLATLYLSSQQCVQQPDGTYTLERTVNGQIQTWQCDPNGIAAWVNGSLNGTYQKFSFNADRSVIYVNPDQNGQSGPARVYAFAYNPSVTGT